MKQSKKMWAILTIALISSLLLVQAPSVYADKETVQEKVLNALRDVAGIDVDKYAITRSDYSTSPTESFVEKYKGGEEVMLTLKSQKNQISVLAVHHNNRLRIMYLYLEDGSPSDIHYTNKLSDDPITATYQALSRLQTFTGNSAILEMMKIAESAKDIDNIAGKTFGNIKCIVYRHPPDFGPPIGNEPVSSVYFMYSTNDAESPNSIGVHFEADGFFVGFHDMWNFYTVGSEKVNVSKEQAIAIAREEAIVAAESVTLGFPSDRPIIAELSLEVRGDSMLYPFWFVEIPIDYPPNLSICGWQVGIWADTNEIEYSHPVGRYGGIPDINDMANISTASPQNRDIIVIAGIIATIAIVSLTTTAVVLKKR
jgi:competence protein ComGC